MHVAAAVKKKKKRRRRNAGKNRRGIQKIHQECFEERSDIAAGEREREREIGGEGKKDDPLLFASPLSDRRVMKKRKEFVDLCRFSADVRHGAVSIPQNPYLGIGISSACSCNEEL